MERRVVMNSNVISRLKTIVGEAYVIDTPAEMAQYLTGKGQAGVVVQPGTAQEVSEIVKLANEQGIKIAVGGQVVNTNGLQDGIALVMKRMNKLIEVDHENLVATVEPGMLHREFLEKMDAENLYFPVEPYNVDTSSIGGCFAIGETDSKAFQYSPTRTYILGFQMVLPTGEIMEIGSKCIKSVSGYDLIHFAVGSRGTLGIFTKLLIKLLPKPQMVKAVVAEFASAQAAAKAFCTMMARHIHPTRLNLINANLAKEGFGSSENYVLVDLEGFKNSTQQLAREVAALLTLSGGENVKIVEDRAEYDQVINSWLKLKAKINGDVDAKIIDFTVGPMKMPQALVGLEGLIGDFKSYPGIIVEGLLGKVRLVLPEMSDRDYEELAVKVNDLAMANGGNVSGLLGAKLKALSYNDEEMWSEIRNLLNTIRANYDPKGILAPGVQF